LIKGTNKKIAFKVPNKKRRHTKIVITTTLITTISQLLGFSARAKQLLK